jgi:hypothetical protein
LGGCRVHHDTATGLLKFDFGRSEYLQRVKLRGIELQEPGSQNVIFKAK